MPSIEYKRVWCKKCQDWELHSHVYPNWKDWFCKVCSTKHEKVMLSEIPEEKIFEQRERYKKQKSISYNKVFDMLCNPSMYGIGGPFSEEREVNITEADAGQKYIDAKHNERIKEERRKIREQKEKDREEVKKYKDLGRNDFCVCGSGKKYKKCCLNKIKQKWVKL